MNMIRANWKVFTSVSLLIVAVICFVLSNRVVAAGNPEWPSRNITFIVPTPPGGSYDLLARVSAPFIQKHLPRSANVIVKNVPGAGGKMGLKELAEAKPDGHAVGIFDPQDVALLQIGGQLEGLDIGMLSWLGRVNVLPDLLVVGSHTGFKKTGDMKGKTVRFVGVLAADMYRTMKIARAIGTEVKFVYYSGSAEGFLAVMRGDTDAIAFNWSVSMRQVKGSGDKLLPLFVNWNERIPGLEVPTGQELGVKIPGLIMGSTKVLAAPPNLPAQIRQMWLEILSKVYADPAWSDQMNKAALSPSLLMGDKLDAWISDIMKDLKENKDIVSSLLSGK